MTLADHLSSFDARKRVATVYGDSPDADLATRFADWNVEFEYRPLPPDTDAAFVTVTVGDEFLGSAALDTLQTAVDPRPRAVGRQSNVADLGPFLELFEATLFHSERRRSLLATSREFEDRAWRVGEGRLHTGFQRPDAVADQWVVYERLAETGLDVHLYFDGDWADPAIPNTAVHTTTDGELGRYWFVVFDAPADAAAQSCALLAAEREPTAYSGFWTYDPSEVDALATYLTETYGRDRRATDG